jgi:flagellar protein FliJ
MGYRTMKARETALRLKRFAADETARKVASLEHMIREFEGMSADLDRQIEAEEARTGIKDPAHFSYSTFAKSAHQRREKLAASILDLRVKYESAQREQRDADDQLNRAMAPEARETLPRRRRTDSARGSLALR